jgi:hypothetical protein
VFAFLLWQLSLTSPAPVCHSVGNNNITGDAANHLATVVLEHAIMTDFCGIPLASLRENSITKLDLEFKGVGVPGAIVLSKLLPSAAAALTSLKCAPARVFPFLPVPLDTVVLSPFPLRPSPAVSTTTSSVPKEQLLSRRASRATRRCNPWSRPPVTRTGRLFAVCQRPLTRLLAVSMTTTSEPRAPPRSPPSSRRRRSPTWSAPPPQNTRVYAH